MLIFLAYSRKIDTRKASSYFFSPQKLEHLFPLKEVKPSLDDR